MERLEAIRTGVLFEYHRATSNEIEKRVNLMIDHCRAVEDERDKLRAELKELAAERDRYIVKVEREAEARNRAEDALERLRRELAPRDTAPKPAHTGYLKLTIERPSNGVSVSEADLKAADEAKGRQEKRSMRAMVDAAVGSALRGLLRAEGPDMPIVYVAGPYRGPNAWEIEENIRRAESLALDAWLIGAAAICPHANTRFFQGAAPDDVWLQGDLAMLARCDAVLLTSDWHRSQGARSEVEFARARGIPILYSLVELQDWLQADREKREKAKAAA